MTYSRAIVTGGAGFIGSCLVDRLVQEGVRVAVVDNLVTGKLENLNPEASFYNLDVCDPLIEKVFRTEKPEVVFHLAAQASVPKSLQEPAEDARTNILGSLNLLMQCWRWDVERVVYSSTGGAIYGDPETLPCPETHPIRPKSPYGASKHSAESYVVCFAALAGFKYAILRYGNVYGPRQDPEGEAGVVAIFASRMLRSMPVVIYGDGRQTRDFIYVSDVAEANLKALSVETEDVYNIGTAQGTSVNDIFAKLAQLTGYSQHPKYAPPRSGEVASIYLDASKAARVLGWRAQVNMDTGLAGTVEHFRRGLKR